MRSHFRREIQFVKHRNVLFAISAAMVVAAIVGLLVRGLNFGIDFLGGTQVSFNDTGAVTISEMRDAFSAAGVTEATVQTTTTNDVAGFMVRTGETDPVQANATADEVASALGLADNTYSVKTIGPNWGGDVTRSMVVAFAVVIVLIVLFVSIRYELKMALMGILSLVQVLVIVAGVYAWTQYEVTPNVVAALLTIMGYCLYDTVVVFHRINENMKAEAPKCTFATMANHSVNEVLVRSLNTSITSLIPVVAMLIFGGETLRDFALAMTVGLVCGCYSSYAIATPIYVMWKTREPKFAKLQKKYGTEIQRWFLNRLPQAAAATATAGASAPAAGVTAGAAVDTQAASANTSANAAAQQPATASAQAPATKPANHGGSKNKKKHKKVQG